MMGAVDELMSLRVPNNWQLAKVDGFICTINTLLNTYHTLRTKLALTLDT